MIDLAGIPVSSGLSFNGNELKIGGVNYITLSDNYVTHKGDGGSNFALLKFSKNKQ